MATQVQKATKGIRYNPMHILSMDILFSDCLMLLMIILCKLIHYSIVRIGEIGTFGRLGIWLSEADL